MLSGGADALVHREVLTCRTEKSRAVVYGTPAALLRGCDSLSGQPFDLGEVAAKLRKLVEGAVLPETIDVNGRVLAYSDFPLVMGILNTTPDSFSDGGNYYADPRSAARCALAMEEAGAAIIDVGGESTRPGSKTVSAGEQRSRVIPVIKAIRELSSVPVSIDTCVPSVAEAAVEAGAGMVNSINGMETPGMVELAVSLSVPVVVMHMKGTPENMQVEPFYSDASAEVQEYLVSRVQTLLRAGLQKKKIIVDPGIGFGKRPGDNLVLINSMKELGIITGCRTLLGHSRKSFLGSITGIEKPDRRDGVTHAVTTHVNGVDILRVHDVEGTVAALKVAEALRRSL
jgi:dihydropteroate synthase